MMKRSGFFILVMSRLAKASATVPKHYRKPRFILPEKFSWPANSYLGDPVAVRIFALDQSENYVLIKSHPLVKWMIRVGDLFGGDAVLGPRLARLWDAMTDRVGTSQPSLNTLLRQWNEQAPPPEARVTDRVLNFTYRTVMDGGLFAKEKAAEEPAGG